MKKILSLSLCIVLIFVMAVSCCALNFDGDGYSIDLPAKTRIINGSSYTETDDEVRANISIVNDHMAFEYGTSITESISAYSYSNNTGYTSADFDDKTIELILEDFESFYNSEICLANPSQGDEYKFNLLNSKTKTLSNGYTALIADYEIFPVFAFLTDGYVRAYFIYTENVIYRFLVYTSEDLDSSDMTDLCYAVENAKLTPETFSGSGSAANVNQNQNTVDYGSDSEQSTPSGSSSNVNLTIIIVVALICAAAVALAVILKKKR